MNYNLYCNYKKIIPLLNAAEIDGLASALNKIPVGEYDVEAERAAEIIGTCNVDIIRLFIHDVNTSPRGWFNEWCCADYLFWARNYEEAIADNIGGYWGIDYFADMCETEEPTAEEIRAEAAAYVRDNCIYAYTENYNQDGQRQPLSGGIVYKVIY